jgi:glycosyltransferase involved in cell wall biosynthesis
MTEQDSRESDRPLRLCFVSREYPPETGWGGIGTFVRNASHGLARLGHEVEVVSVALTGWTSVTEDGPVRVHRVPDTRTPLRLLVARYGSRAEPIVSLFERSLSVARYLARLTARAPFDLIEFPEWGAEGLVAMTSPRRRARLVVRLHTSLQILARLNANTPRRSPSFWLSTRSERWGVRRADAVFSPSRALAALTADDMGFDPHSVHVVPNPIEIEAFQPGAPATSGPPVILYVGKVERRKGVHLLAQALPAVLGKFPEAVVEFLGPDTRTGPGGASMREHILGAVPEEVRQRLVFRGNVPRAELPLHYRRSCVTVFPSLFENFPNVCLEAMACGRPVVGSQASGMAEMIVDGQSGVLVAPGDVPGLTAALLRVLENPEWAEGLGRAARLRVEQVYALDAVARRMAACFRRVIARRPCPPHEV